MTRRLIILLIVLTAGLATVHLLPKAQPRKDSAIRMELPRIVGLGWTAGRDKKPEDKETKILGDDTDFKRRSYHRSPSGMNADGAIEAIEASIVLSGRDMARSIHRPERCLDAQGWNLDPGQYVEVPLRNGKKLFVRRLLCTRPVQTSAGPVTFSMLNYYWFVGHDTVTASHYQRAWQDIKDRIFEGTDQRWAYVTVSMYLTPLEPYLMTEFDDPSDLESRLSEEELKRRKLWPCAFTTEEGDKLIVEFIRDLFPDIADLDAIKTWSDPS